MMVRQTWTLLCALFLGGAIALQAQEPVPTILGFGEQGDGWTFNASGGTAPSVTGGTLRLLDDAEQNAAKSAWFTQPVALTGPWVCRFRMVRVKTSNNLVGEGITFGFQRIAPNYLGTSGTSLGLLNSSGFPVNETGAVLFRNGNDGSTIADSYRWSEGFGSRSQPQSTGWVSLSALSPVDVIISGSANRVQVILIQNQQVCTWSGSLGTISAEPVYLGFTGGTSTRTLGVHISDFYFGPPSDKSAVARPDYVQLTGWEAVIPVLANDEPSPDGARLLLRDVGGARFGWADIQDDGTVLYQATADPWPGDDWFTYTVMDSAGRSATGEVHVTAGLRPGTYLARFERGSDPLHKHHLLTVTVTRSGAVSGTLRQAGRKTVPFRAKFDAEGKANLGALGHLDRNVAPGLVAFDLTFPGEEGASGVALRAVPPDTVDYSTGVTNSNSLNNEDLFGDGWHTRTTTPKGRVRLAGMTMDGQPYTLGTQVDVRQRYPVHVSLNKRLGVLAGYPPLEGDYNTSTKQVRAPGGTGAYATGFEEEIGTWMAPYRKPAARFTALGEEAGRGPLWVRMFTKVPGAEEDDLLTVMGLNHRIWLLLLPEFVAANPSNGIFRGIIEDPTAKGTFLPCKGVIMQPGSGRGVIKTKTTAGRVRLDFQWDMPPYAGMR